MRPKPRGFAWDAVNQAWEPSVDHGYLNDAIRAAIREAKDAPGGIFALKFNHVVMIISAHSEAYDVEGAYMKAYHPQPRPGVVRIIDCTGAPEVWVAGGELA
ncbi:MAG TPA: hypothetical protein VEI97_11295 [bacterium]|nr:hypothetical protein [bacterium]